MFETKKLAGGQVLITGEDTAGNTGKQVVDGTEWAELARAKADREVHENFEQTVEQFFAPLTEAIDQLNAAHQPTVDPLFQVVLSEGEAATPGEAAIVAHLSLDSAILRLIEEDATAPRLLWLSDSELVILEAEAPADVEPVAF